MRAFVFPGQGSQAVGMGKALAEAFTPARLVFEEVDDALGQKRYVLLTPVDLLPALVVLLTLEFGPHHSPLRRHRTRRMPGR